MRNERSPLLAIFRTPLQGRILAEVYLRDRHAPLSAADLARLLGEPSASVHREVRRLVDAGLLEQTPVGRALTLSRPSNSLVVGPLTDLLNVTFGPLPVLSELLEGVAGVSEAYIYGSWAARYSGEHGAAPNDVDVLVVGDPDPAELDDLAAAAEVRLRREVNIRTVDPERWLDPESDPFLTHVRDRPLVALGDGSSRRASRSLDDSALGDQDSVAVGSSR
jgi:predicted nucleotidyltransferase